MKLEHKTDMTQTLEKLMDEGAFDGRSVFLFGHCNATENIADYLTSRGVIPTAILDNSASKQGLDYRCVPVSAPEIIHDFNADNSMILIASRFYADMYAQLRRLGYRGEVIKVSECNSFAEYSLSDETFERKKARMLRGAKTLERIRGMYPEVHLVVCPYDALGDVYWAMAFLPSYCKKYGIREVAAVTTGNGCSQVAELFLKDNIVTLGETEMDEFVQALVFSCESNCIIAHHNRPYTDVIINFLSKKFLSFIDYYRCAVYGLSADATPAAPASTAVFENTEDMMKGRSVIISPYAKSVVAPPACFWEAIAAEYTGHGYRVYTNTVGNQAPINGTAPLSLQISQLISAAEYAGTFIGLRNGICDVLHTSECEKTVVFPDCYYSSTPHKVEDFFHLPGWEKKIFIY